MKPLPRRIFLQGLGGALIGLPLLEAQEAQAAITAITPRRFVVFFENGGTLSATNNSGSRANGSGAENGMDGWDPAQFTETLNLGLIHKAALSGLEPSLLLLRGIDNQEQKTGHHRTNATALTAANAVQVAGTTLGDFGVPSNWTLPTPSIDAVLAKRLKERFPNTPYRSLNFELAFSKFGTYGSPFYTYHPTDVTKVIPTPLTRNPLAAFQQLFPAGFSVGGSDAGVVLSRDELIGQSVLDGTQAMLTQYRGRFSSADYQTIDAHLTALRDIELRLEELRKPIDPPTASCTKPTNIVSSGFTSTTSNSALEGVAGNILGPLLVDLGLAALRCGMTNVLTLNIPDLPTPWTTNSFKQSYGHAMGHFSKSVGSTGGDKASGNAWRETMLANRVWRMSLFARALNGLKAVNEGNGRTMLDNTIAMETSEFSNAGKHIAVNVPVILAGGKGVLRTGRYVSFNTRAASNPSTSEYSTQSSIHNVYTTILQAFGYDDGHFGSNSSDRKGVLAGTLV